ncbi:MAG: hypothetical protein HEQ35_23305 [Gloeotrichia echinulata IR180]|nr:hypothetical protein [Gloeotrichia echinulata DEX184]
MKIKTLPCESRDWGHNDRSVHRWGLGTCTELVEVLGIGDWEGREKSFLNIQYRIPNN